jgi:glycosyltransferase involved in cell wall biosynthesis
VRVEIVVPCYNEAERLDLQLVRTLVDHPEITALLVDDGSTDRTAERIAEIQAEIAADLGDRVRFLGLPKNGGKAEAVRQGMLDALAHGAEVTGYLDADFATPPEEAHRLLSAMKTTGAKAVLGARVARLGARIDRSPMRHYLGRLFVTVASTSLGVAVYDSQCGAKLFSDTPAFRLALSQPFASRWAFDVELLGRLFAGGEGAPPLREEDCLELPLRAWKDVAGSKLSRSAMIGAGLDVLRLTARVMLHGPRGHFMDEK